MAAKYYWIKERHNPQIGVYYFGLGQITMKEAKRHESPLYGTNYMHEFKIKAEYDAEIARLKATGKKVQ